MLESHLPRAVFARLYFTLRLKPKEAPVTTMIPRRKACVVRTEAARGEVNREVEGERERIGR